MDRALSLTKAEITAWLHFERLKITLYRSSDNAGASQYGIKMRRATGVEGRAHVRANAKFKCTMIG